MWLTGGYFYPVVKFLLTRAFLVAEIGYRLLSEFEIPFCDFSQNSDDRYM